MIQITVIDGASKQKTITSEKLSLMLGRAPSNDVCLEAEGISRYHARLTIEGDQIVIEDLNSTNGTFVNSKAITKCTVTHNDQITIGRAIVSVFYNSSSKKTIENVQETEEESAETGDSDRQENQNVRMKETFGGGDTEHQLEVPHLEEDDDSKSDPLPLESPDQLKQGEKFYWESLKSFLSPIWKYITDEATSEIMINGPDEIYIEQKGEIRKIDNAFTEDQLKAAVLNIAQYVGRRVTEEEPYLDARLPDGSRVAILLPPCSRKGIGVAIRKFSKEKLTIEKLLKFGSFTDEMALFLSAAVLLKKNIIISGGTSSGKTSLLNAVSSLIPNGERVITIEDSAELQLDQEHVLPFETKPPDKKGRGQVTIRDLVKASLRMRPDRIVVGEIRGGEAIDLLQAMNTGHSGSMATVHASSPKQALTRLETLSLFSGLDIPMRALREQVASAIDIIIQASRLPDHSRKVTHISEVGPLREDGTYEVNDIFRYTFLRMGENRKAEGKHEWSGIVPSMLEEMKTAGIEEAVALFTK